MKDHQAHRLYHQGKPGIFIQNLLLVGYNFTPCPYNLPILNSQLPPKQIAPRDQRLDAVTKVMAVEVPPPGKVQELIVVTNERSQSDGMEVAEGGHLFVPVEDVRFGSTRHDPAKNAFTHVEVNPKEGFGELPKGPRQESGQASARRRCHSRAAL